MVKFYRHNLCVLQRQKGHRAWGHQVATGNFLRLLAVCLTLLIACYTFAQADAIDSKGHKIHLSDYRGKWLLVNYWADWCHACLKEMPDLARLQAKYPDKVTLIGVNFDEKPDQYLNNFISKHHLNFSMTAHLDPTLLGLAAPMATVPTSVLIDPQGKINKVILQPKVLSQWEHLIGLTPAS